ncbi:MAG: hypothetical protein GY809_14680 [Planctomycetes bacterium]|nr:hypothetical protein [Planctomycetota bacterium]
MQTIIHGNTEQYCAEPYCDCRYLSQKAYCHKYPDQQCQHGDKKDKHRLPVTEQQNKNYA